MSYDSSDLEETTETYLLPMPLVDWQTVVGAVEPLRDVTRNMARTLRQHGYLSPGIQVVHPGPRGLAGRSTYHSVLWLWANRCRVAGFEEDALLLQEAATAVENRFDGVLKEFLTGHTVGELPTAPFFGDLMAGTADALAGASCLADSVLVAGQAAIADDLGHVVGLAPTGEAAVVDLPARMFDLHGLAPGAPAWVVQLVHGHAAVTDLDPVVATTLPSPLGHHFEWARVEAVGRQLFDLVARTGDEDLAAAVFQATAAHMPPDEYWDELLEDASAGRLPVRHLRPVG